MKIKRFNEAFNANKDEEKRFLEFTKELAKISKKYKIAIESTGGVYIFKEDVNLDNLEYSTDATSGDLEFAK